MRNQISGVLFGKLPWGGVKGGLKLFKCGRVSFLSKADSWFRKNWSYE